jgi:phosphorylase kinase alpha/beta subunit
MVMYLGVDENNAPLTVKDLLKGLYDKACQQKLWGLVRHSAGLFDHLLIAEFLI